MKDLKLKTFKIVCIILVVTFIISGCTSIPSDDTEELLPDNPIVQEEENTLRFPYDFEEGIRPYQTGNIHNRYITELVCRSMVHLKDDFSYEYDLVSSIESADNRIWYIYIDEGLSFPNGSEFTAYDLRYSLNCAMSDGSYYSSGLDIVSSTQIINSTCLKVVLLYPVRNFPNLLIFPVISYKTEKDPEYFPGGYHFADNDTLIAESEEYPIQEISLIQADDWDLLVYEMRLGNYSCIYESNPLSLGNASIGGITGLTTNHMVYIGYNSTNNLTYYSDFRKAIASSIDYDYIISAVYGNYADKPSGLYSSKFYESTFLSPNRLDLMSASLLLDGLGMTEYDSEGYRLTKRGKRLSVEILVCSESSTKLSLANAIVDMLKEIGIEGIINSVSYNKYLTALQNYDYDIYIAEARMDYDMDISKIITPKAYQIPGISYIDYGIVQSEYLYEQYLQYMSGAISLDSFNSSYQNLMPFTPICFAKTSMIFSRELNYNILGTNWDLFYNIKEWKTNA